MHSYRPVHAIWHDGSRRAPHGVNLCFLDCLIRLISKSTKRVLS